MSHIPLSRHLPEKQRRLESFLQDVLRSVAQPFIQKDIEQLVRNAQRDPDASVEITLNWIRQHYAHNNQIERLVLRHLNQPYK